MHNKGNHPHITSMPPRYDRRRIWTIVILGCVGVGLIDGGQIGMQNYIRSHKVEWPPIIFQTSEWIIFGLLTAIPFALSDRFPLQRGKLRGSIAVHALGAIVLCLIWASLGVALRQWLGIGWGIPIRQELHDWILISLPWSFILYFAVLGTFHAFRYHQEARERELQASQLAAQLSDTQLRVLRAQLQPHFLFNALNAITVLVRDQRDAAAVRMLDQLSELLRQVLRSDRPHRITLREELQLLRQYLDIEQTRFSDRLRIEYVVDDAALDGLVPAFILQPLVENALRHGLGDKLDNAVLEIHARRAGDELVLTVRDNGRGLPADWSMGVGLRNTQERLATMYGAAARLQLQTRTDGGTEAMVIVPWSTEAQ